MSTFSSTVLTRLRKLLPDTPDNEQIYFSALRKQGRFWVDDPERPTVFVAVTGGNAPVCFLRELVPDADVDWEAALHTVNPKSALAGEVGLIRSLSKRLEYGAPSIEVVCAQRGIIRTNGELAVQVVRYSKEAFDLVDRNARWMWDAYRGIHHALEDFPAFGIYEGKRIVALAAVYSHSLKWANICYWVHENFRHREYATRCAAALTSLLNKRGLSAVASTDETHLPSLSVMRKIGLHEYSRHGFAPPKSSSR